MTLSPEFNSMRTRSRSHNTDSDTNGALNRDQLQQLPDDSFALNDEALSDHPDKKDVDDRETAPVNNEAASPPSSISQKVKKDDTLKTDDINLKVFDFDTALPRKRGRPRKRKLGNNISGNDTSTLKTTQQHGSKASAEKKSTSSSSTVSKAEDRKGKEDESVDNQEAAQVIEDKEHKEINAEVPVKRRGRKKKATPATTMPAPRAPRNNADTDTKPSTPIKWTLPHLLHNKDSMLTTAVNLKNNVTMDLIDKLPEKDRDELMKLLPPADIDFVKRNDDGGDTCSIIVAKSLDEHEQLSKQPETYKPIISQRLISPSFTQAIEDFQVNLQHGRYDNNPKPATGRGRKRKEEVEEEHDDFKDENFEAYWGERLKKRSKKGGGGRR